MIANIISKKSGRVVQITEGRFNMIGKRNNICDNCEIDRGQNVTSDKTENVRTKIIFFPMRLI